MDGGVGLDGVEGRNVHRAEVGDAAQVVAHHVDDHHVLGSVLGAAEQFGDQALVDAGIGMARTGALHGPRRQLIAGAMHEQLG